MEAVLLVCLSVGGLLAYLYHELHQGERKTKGESMGRWMDNGERVYYDTTPLLKRIRKWFVWFGGWERPHWEGDCYSTRWQLRNSWNRKIASPTPISIFGHSATFYGWGFRVRLWRRPSLHFTVSRYRRSYPTRIYISQDGTPPRPGESGIRIWPRAAHYWN